MSAPAGTDTPLVLHRVPLDLPADRLARLGASLDGDERRRAAAFHAAADRDRFVARHGWLRLAAGRRLGCPPEQVPLVAPRDGKPWLRGTQLRFSVSRSAGAALIALSWSGEVGVDLEVLREEPDPLRFAARWFTPAERRAVQRAPADQRSRRCLELWTRKEAYLKATGAGLAISPRSVEVAAPAGQPARIGAWAVHQLDAGAGVAAAVAVPDRQPPIPIPPLTPLRADPA